MMQEEQILKELKKYFKDVKLEQQSSRYDIIAKEKRSGYTLYISSYTKDNALKMDYSWCELLIHTRNECAMIITKSGEKYYYMIAAFMDEDKVFVKKYSDFKELNSDNVTRLGWQLGAKYQNINILPTEYLRVVKTIAFNDSELFEGAVKYVRKFQDNYKMKTQSQPFTQKERLNRLIYGTPENEYPQDELDKVILNIVKQSYPQATIKSKLLVFDNDFLFYRREVDKQRHEFIYSIFDDLEHINQQESRKLSLEVYYYRSVFGSTKVKMDQGDIQNKKVFDLLNTYEPLSAMIL